jgi:hypothetical protein
MDMLHTPPPGSAHRVKEAIRAMRDLVNLKSLAQELALLLNTDAILAESILYADRLRGLASESIQPEQLDRYVAGIFGYRWEAWQSDRDAFVLNELTTESRWTTQAEAELSPHTVDGLVSAKVPLIARRLSASLLVEVEPITSREMLLRCVEWLRDACALLTIGAKERPVGAREVTVTVWCPHENFDRWKLGSGTVNRATAQALGSTTAREWLKSSGFRVGTVHSDLLVRALKTKLIAVRVATWTLDTINRRLSGD